MQITANTPTECTQYIGSLNDVPEKMSFLASSPRTQVPNTSFDLNFNKRSDHLSITNYNPQTYYEDYLMTTTQSTSIQKLQSRQIEKLLTHREDGSRGSSLVEIGCGDGSFLRHASRHLTRVLGIEPSKRFAGEARKQGFDVISEFLSTEKTITSETFDYFAARQVFEHLPDPLDVLIAIRNMLNEGAIGLIEVPNGHRALRLGRFYEFFPDHAHYYSVKSLCQLAHDAGFDVLECSPSFGNDYLELYLQKQTNPTVLHSAMLKKRSDVIHTLSQHINAQDNAGKRIAIWGAGSKTLCILAAGLPSDRFDCVIDSDPHKQGKFIPNTTLQVRSPLDLSNAGIDQIIVLALSYQREIGQQARAQIPSCKEIYTVNNLAGLESLNSDI
jgi:2-polyprenyl-3-methyl-5-hydroxy-6-metoxy-1,4-benzoquinol methylase